MRLYLPIFLAAASFVAALVSMVMQYNKSGILSFSDLAVVFAALAAGVLVERLYESDRELHRLREELRKSKAAEKQVELDVGEDEE